MHNQKSEIRLAGRLRDVCNGCAKRYVGCHGRCRRYADAKAASEEKKAMISAARETDKQMRGYANERIDVRMRKEHCGK